MTDFKHVVPAEPGWRVVEIGRRLDDKPWFGRETPVIAWGMYSTADGGTCVLPITVTGAFETWDGAILEEKGLSELPRTNFFLVNPKGGVLDQGVVSWNSVQECCDAMHNIWLNEQI